MSDRSEDPDLPGDAAFVPTPPSVQVAVETPDGPKWALKIALPIKEQAAIHHNQLRYAELQKLRAGMANQYEQTRYRH